MRADHQLFVIEISGAGSPYEFADKCEKPDYWQILYPKNGLDELSSKDVQNAVYQKLDEINPDVIIAGAIAFPSGANAVSWAKINNKPVIIFDDAKLEDVQRGFITNYIKRNIFNGVDAVIYPAAPWLETAKFWGFEQERVYFGIDVVDNSFWKQGVQTCTKKDFFITVGRMISVKNFMYLLREYKRYVSLCEDAFKLVFVGDGPEKECLQKFVLDNDLEQKVVFKGFQSQENLRELYQQAVGYCCSSEYDTWGLVINEAMAAGLPILASTNCGATSSLVIDAINGYTFDPFQDGALCDKFLVFNNLSQSERERMSQKSLEIIDEWGLDKFVSGCMEAIDYVVAHPRKKPSFLSMAIIKSWRGRYRPI